MSNPTTIACSDHHISMNCGNQIGQVPCRSQLLKLLQEMEYDECP